MVLTEQNLTGNYQTPLNDLTKQVSGDLPSPGDRLSGVSYFSALELLARNLGNAIAYQMILDTDSSTRRE